VLDPNAATREQLVAAGVPAGAADAMVAGRPFADMRAVDRALAQAQVDSAARRAVYARVWRPDRPEYRVARGDPAHPGRRRRAWRASSRSTVPTRTWRASAARSASTSNEAEVARLEKFVTIR
jgi:hypothetical protein